MKPSADTLLLIHMASNFAPVTAAPRPPPDGPRRKGRWHQRAFCWEALAPPPDQTPSRRPIVHHPPPPAHCCTLTFGTTKEYARWRAIQDTKPLPLRCSIAAFYAQSPAKAEHTHTYTHTQPHPHPHPHPHATRSVFISQHWAQAAAKASCRSQNYKHIHKLTIWLFAK